MAIRNDIYVRWDLSPRLIIVDASSSEISMQDLNDTCRYLESTVEGMDEPILLNSSGKEELGSGITVGLTVQLLNAKLYFQERTWTLTTGVATATDNDTLLKDTSANFYLNNISPGNIVYNASTGAMATIIEIYDTSIYSLPLSGGFRQVWQAGDGYAIYPNELCVTGGGNLVALDIDGEPTYPILQAPNVQSTLTSSSSATSQNLGAIQYASYQDGVWISETGSFGTEYPTGTPIQPVNNLTDAKIIASEQGFDKLKFLSDWTFTSSTVLTNFEIIGQGNQRTTFTYNPGAILAGCEVSEAKLTGTVAGLVGMKDSFLSNLTSDGTIPGLPYDQDVVVERCLLDGSLGVPVNYTGTLKVLDCWSNIPGNNTPEFNLNNSPCNIFLRNYSGGILITNSNSNNIVSIDLVSGQVKLSDTITNGQYTVRGVGTLTNNSTALINSDGLMSKDTIAGAVQDEIGQEIQFASFQNAIWIDNINGVYTTSYPSGTRVLPVKDISTATYIAEQLGIKALRLLTDISIGYDDNIENYEMIGVTHVETNIYIDSSAYVHGVKISNARVSGILDGHSELNSCTVEDLSYVNGHIHNSGLKGNIILDGNEDAVFVNCSAIDRNNLPIIDLNNGGQNLVMSNWSGAIKIKNNDDPSTLISIGMDAGNVTLDSTITQGNIGISGIGLFVNNADASAIVNTNGLINKSNIADAVLDTELYPFTQSGTVAFSLQLASYDNAIHVDNINGSVGNSYPYGTFELPVNNVEQAVEIGQELGIKTIKIRGDYVFDSSILVPGLKIVGDGDTRSKFSFVSKMIIPNIIIENAELSGWLSGITALNDCHIIDFGSDTFMPNDNEISIKNTLIQGTTTLPSTYSGTMQVLNSWAMPDASGNPPVFNHGNSTASLQVRNLSGIVVFENITEEVDIRVYLNSGGVILNNSITSGNFVFTGTGTIQNNSSSITSINTEALISKNIISSAVWDEEIINHIDEKSTGRAMLELSYDGFIYIDTNSSNIGQEFPFGSPQKPVNNLTDAIAIGNLYGINDFKLAGTLVLDQEVSGYAFFNNGNAKIDMNNQVALASQFHDVKMYGIQNTVGIFERCRITDLQGINGVYRECYFLDDIPMLVGSSSVIFNNCRSQVAGNDSPIFDCSNGNIDWSNRAYSGGIKIINFKDSNNKTTQEFIAGKLNLDSSDTNGLITARGAFALNKNGSTIDVDTLGKAAGWRDDISIINDPSTAGNVLWNNAKKTVNKLIPFLFAK